MSADGATTIRVLVADDQAVIRAGLRMILDNEPDLAVVAEAADGLEAVKAAASARPDVVLMDVRMPLLDGLEATRRIVASSDAPPRVLVLTTFDVDEYLFDALRAGASGFLLKDVAPDPLPAVDSQVELAAVRIAQEGVTNALRHAEARRAVVRVAEEAGYLVVAVDDDGRSSKAPAISASGHGLRGMAERAAACGGRLDIACSDLGGWSVRATLPCHQDGRP